MNDTISSQVDPRTQGEEADTTSAAADSGNLKRSLQMKMFASQRDKNAVAHSGKEMPLGQIVGVIFDVKKKIGTLPDGTQKESRLAIGDFEAMVYKTGEVYNSTAAYLPDYFLETVESILEKSNEGAVMCAIELVLVPTGKSIPVAYEVKNLAVRRPENPINILKAELANAGRLRLPPPPAAVPQLPGEMRMVPALEAPSAPVEEAEIQPVVDGAPDVEAPDLSDEAMSGEPRGPAPTPAGGHGRKGKAGAAA